VPPCRTGQFSFNAFGIEEADVLVTVFRIEDGKYRLFAPTYTIRGTAFNDVTVGGAPTRRKDHSASLFRHLASGVQCFHHNNDSLDLIEDLAGRKNGRHLTCARHFRWGLLRLVELDFLRLQDWSEARHG
jgi:hypothetical protein